MIRPGVHHVTKQPRVLAECDEDGCDESAYLHDEMTIYTGGYSMRAIGWEVSNARGLMNGGLPARCPTHAEYVEQCPHDVVVLLDRVRVCQRCGRTPDTTEGVAA